MAAFEGKTGAEAPPSYIRSVLAGAPQFWTRVPAPRTRASGLSLEVFQYAINGARCRPSSCKGRAAALVRGGTVTFGIRASLDTTQPRVSPRRTATTLVDARPLVARNGSAQIQGSARGLQSCTEVIRWLERNKTDPNTRTAAIPTCGAPLDHLRGESGLYESVPPLDPPRDPAAELTSLQFILHLPRVAVLANGVKSLEQSTSTTPPPSGMLRFSAS